MDGYENYRAAVAAAIESLDHELIRAEDFPSSNSASRIACLQAVREADLVILILGERYGWADTASGLSPTHEEFREAKAEGKIMAFVQNGVAFESAQEKFIAEVENYDTGLHRGRRFDTSEQLRTEVTRAISRYQLAAATTPINVASILETAKSLIPQQNQNYLSTQRPLLHLAVAGGPSQSILRPSEIEDEAMISSLVSDLTNGPRAYFSYRFRTEPKLEQGALIISQENGSRFRVDEAAAMLISVRIVEAEEGMKPLIEENVGDALDLALGFADQMLERFDRTQKLSRIVLVASIETASMFGWRTAAEQNANPKSGSFGMFNKEPRPIHLNPADRTRMALKSERAAIVQDLLALLRRQHSS